MPVRGDAINFSDLGIMKGVCFTNDPDADLDGSGSVNSCRFLR